MRVLVVGAGIGGLGVAIALHRAGHEPIVFERAGALEAVGAGIALSANAMAACDRLGVADELRRRGLVAKRAQIRNPSGRVLAEIPYEERGWEMVGVHRADLQQTLLGALPDGVVRLGCACVGIEREDERVAVRLEGGGREEGDVLVGADGLRSVARASLFGEEPLCYSGQVGWRAVSEFPADHLDATFSETWGPGSRFGLVPIGTDRLYWFVAENAEEGAPLPPQPKDDFRSRFAGWHDPIPEVVEGTDESSLSRTFIYDRPPAKRWGEGRVTLVGDAAHPMTPNLGQGAAQALEDAVVLGRELAGTGGAEAALRRYEQRRRKRASRIVKQSFQAGRMAQLTSPRACAVRDLLVRALPKRLALAQQARIFAADLD